MVSLNKEMSIWWNIGVIWDKITYPFRRVFDWMVKSIQYSILLWSDFDWDYVYFLKLMRYKLSRMRKRIIANNLIRAAEQVGAEIKHAEDLLTHLIEDDFHEDLMDAHEKKYGRFTFRDDDNIFSREFVNTEEEKKQEQQEFREILDKQYEAREQCKRELVEHVICRLERWWD